ncbi:ricin-type beta-trefoil lectin domain protein [Streptomyces sp. VRA16 Mangrove soil]|uniref:ricin-type beta-trefoil lectin domain protein n=1 Tax=Streptomyces sp. VRA16 Mangrove soil TaxID=2817434 RepID=UPI001E535D79|nr:ricin-type beta-trefoil lectin domain protein [Streptomyces sp. VRA16 Mangrove soil]
MIGGFGDVWGVLSWSGRGWLARTGVQRSRRAALRLTVIGTLFMALVVGAFAGNAAAAPPGSGDRSGVELVDLPDRDPAVAAEESALSELATSDTAPPKEYDPAATAAPVDTTPAQEEVTGLAPGDSVAVGDLPIEVGAPEDATAEEAASLDGTWQASVVPQTDLDAVSMEGLAFKVTPPAGATGEATVTLDYTAFAELYGANWADRLNLTQYPSCVLTTPDVESCTEPVALDTDQEVTAQDDDTEDDGKLDGERRLTATVDVAALAGDTTATTASTARADGKGTDLADDAVYRGPPSAKTATQIADSAGSSVLVAGSHGSGSGGDFSATPLVSAGSWSAGGSSGAFTYSYGLNTPSVPGGPSPSVTFSYNSQVVDGRTSATNNQPSWIGDGWEYNPGSITRTYKACTDDRDNGNNATHKTGDLCWGSDNAVMTLGGTTTELVKNDADGTWATANGDGSKVDLIKDTSLANGDNDGEYWRITTRDGMRYYFGRNKTSTWKDGDPLTNSVLTVPVAGNQSGEPCYDASFAKSFCDQGWRWNLDFVQDPQDNMMSLWWTKETNHYAKDNKFKAAVSYDRGGYLNRIDYGQRASTLYTTKPISQVVFDTDERCFKEGEVTCSDTNFTSGNFAQNRIWYDTPADLYCAGGTKECWVPVPTFWSRKRLAKVTTLTQRTEGSTELTPVDRWTLDQSLPAHRTDEGTALWLESITRTGYTADGEPAEDSLNPVEFLPNIQSMPNRVKRGANDPNPVFDRLRIQRVVNEYGGETLVDYKKPDADSACGTGTGFPKPEDNTGLCFPAYWHPDPDKADETIDWFHKYVVAGVQELPNLAGSPAETTAYQYVGDGAWALNQAEFSKKKTRTYDQWRGFGVVRTITGADSTTQYTSTTRGMSETRYFRGMDGDPLPGGGKRAVTVTDHAGDKIATDDIAYQGRVAETLTYTKYNGELLTRSVDYPTTPQVLATRARDDGVPALKAYRVDTAKSKTWTRSSGSGDDPDTERTTTTTSTYDATYGLPLTVETTADTDTGDTTCTVNSYVHNTDRHLIGLPKQSLTTAGTCAHAPSATADEWISGSRVAYDNQVYGTAPTVGLATETWDISGDGGSWTENGTVGYDSYGRATSTTDALQHKETTTYGPTTGQVFKVTSTNALNQSSTSTIDPARGTTLTDTDPNGNTTAYAYDAYGRTTYAWAPGQTPGDTDEASAHFTYTIVQGEPVHVTSETLKEDGSYEKGVTFYDGLGRERQRQEPAVGGGRLITDTLYSADGTVRQTNNAYFANGEPGDEMFDVDSDSQVQNATLYAYDGLGRVLTETPYLAGVAKPSKATSYEYGSDYSVVNDPAGGTRQRSYSDALGRTTRVDTYTDINRTVFRSTRYEYDARGDRVKAVDSEDNTWSWTYDARGRELTSTDPDAGTSHTTYDVLDRAETTEDPRGVKVWTKYDALSRPLEQRLNNSSGTLLQANTYDTVTGGIGQPATSTRYTDGLGYTMSVTGYTEDYQATVQQLKLPPSIATQYGLKDTYTYSYDYSKQGQLRSTTLPAAGAFDAEKVVTRYNEDGLPVSTSGLNWYTADTEYSPWGEVLRSVAGEQPSRVWTTNLYDTTTGELTRQIVDRESTSDTTAVTGHRVNSRYYAYDNAGNITQTTDVSNSTTDRQCFTYDGLGQLTEAWTSPNEACRPTDKTSAAPSYDDGTTNVTAANDGYWQSFTYDAMGNRKKLVEHDAAGDTAKDATTDYVYGKADGSQPHTLTGMERTYTTDAGARVKESSTLQYDAGGNTTTRTTGGNEQGLTWTWDGQAETVSGFGAHGSGEFVNTATHRCLDVQSSSTTAGTPLQIYSCNGTKAQKLRIDPASDSDATTGALKVLGQCVMPKDGATAAGTAVVLAKCTGAANQQWTTTSTGALKHVASGKCAALPGGTTTPGTDLQLATCDGSAGQVWKPADQIRYVYGPTGERLLALSDSEHTLYLGDTTVSTNAGGDLSYTERYYSQPGASTVMRHAQGTSAATLSVQVSDQNGSAYVNVQLAQGNKVQFSKATPFGTERAESASWLSHQGYVGGGEDSSTGLIHLGAREYDPVTGRFLSADPVVDLGDPVQLNGYVYSENNPVTYADPSGLSSGTDASDYYDGPSDSAVAGARSTASRTLGDVILSTGWAVLKEFLGWNDVVGCFSRGDLWACGSLLMDAIPWGAIFSKGKKIWGAIRATMSAVSAWRKAVTQAKKILAIAKKAWEVARKMAAAAKAAAKRAAQLKKKAQAAKAAATRAAKRQTQKIGNATQRKARSEARKTASSKPSTTARKKSEGGGNETSSAKGEGDGDTCNSFVPGTRVLMADGTTKAIQDVKLGDKVLATDPDTGDTTVETVTAEIKGQGLKHLVKVTIDIDGKKGTKTASVTATDGHPFWVEELHAWVPATSLKSGEWLRTSAGTYVQISAVKRWTVASSTVNNLTVSKVHTYYVLAGAAPVLVHNCGGSGSTADLSTPELIQQVADRADTRIASSGNRAVDGSRKHKYAETILDRYQTIFEDRGLITERSYLGKVQVPHGTKGSARPDVFDPSTGIAYDYKFTKNPPGIGKRQWDKNADNVPGLFLTVPVVPR